MISLYFKGEMIIEVINERYRQKSFFCGRAEACRLENRRNQRKTGGFTRTLYGEKENSALELSR
jgi:hypothetical protein